MSIREITTNNSYLTYTDPVTQDIETIASQDDASASSKELVVNGDFSDGTTGWTLLNGVEVNTIDGITEVINTENDWGQVNGQSLSYGLYYVSSSAKKGNINAMLRFETNFVNNQITFTNDFFEEKGFVVDAVSGPNTRIALPLDNVLGSNAYYEYVSVKQVLPVSTKYRMTNDFSNAVSHDIPFSQADLDLMKADPLTLTRVWFDGLVLPSGLAKVNIKYLYTGSEGILGGANVHDLVTVTDAIIQNYTEACRTTHENTAVGMSNLLLEQDASGVPIATVPSNTVDFKNSNGANVNTGFKPSLPKMTIKEVVSGNLADLDVDGNPLGTFSERTEHRAIKMWEEEGEPNSWERETTTANETMEIPVIATNTYDMTIEWGDGDSETYTGDGSVKPSHVYVNAGSYEVVLTGICPQLYFYGTAEVSKVTKILGLGETGLITCSEMYRDAVNLQDCTFGLCDTSKVTNMYYMMYNWKSMTTTPDLSSFNTLNVTNMYSMMYGWSSMTTAPDLTSFDTSNVTNMSYMMSNWTNIVTPPDFTSFDTSNVTDMYAMMRNWSSMGEIGNIGIENFNVSSLTTASDMLAGTTVATATMDLILVNWEAQSHQSNVTVHFGEGNYTLGGAAETAYNNLVADGWSISGITGV